MDISSLIQRRLSFFDIFWPSSVLILSSAAIRFLLTRSLFSLLQARALQTLAQLASSKEEERRDAVAFILETWPGYWNRLIIGNLDRLLYLFPPKWGECSLSVNWCWDELEVALFLGNHHFMVWNQNGKLLGWIRVLYANSIFGVGWALFDAPTRRW